MRYYYGNKNIFRALDEAEFWKRQETEHTQVIRLVTPGLEKEFADSLEDFERSFGAVNSKLVSFVTSVERSKGDIGQEIRTEILRLLKYCFRQSEEFVLLLKHILGKSAAVKANASSAVVINHIIRESEYFTGIGRLILED